MWIHLLGHAVGDIVLKEFCQIVSKVLNSVGVFGRLGGEEFCVTIFDKDDVYVDSLSEKIRIECEKNVIMSDDVKIKFTISLGISKKEKNSQHIDEILHKADELLYSAKKEGRNRVIRISNK